MPGGTSGLPMVPADWLAQRHPWLSGLGSVAASGARILMILVPAWVATSAAQRAIRGVRLRDDDGNLHVVPNGGIGSVINMGRGHSQAVVDVGVGHGADLGQWAVRRECLRRLKQAVDAAGIEIPLPPLTLHRRSGGTAPAAAAVSAR